ncbi:hypothetical protein RAA17_12555 [Komagataeibacter rhaeticus]|nr:hypothetical protein [Komagataeibacter rhaeticus]
MAGLGLAATAAGRSMTGFVARLVALRGRHSSLRAARYMHGRHRPMPDLPDISWFCPDGSLIGAAQWGMRAFTSWGCGGPARMRMARWT